MARTTRFLVQDSMRTMRYRSSASSATVFVIQPDEPGRSTMDGMPHVVHRPTVPIVPCVRDPQGSFVVAKEIATQLATCLPLKCEPRGMLDQQQAERVRKCSLPRGRRRSELAGIRCRRLWRVMAGSLRVDRRGQSSEVDSKRQGGRYDRLGRHGSNSLLCCRSVASRPEHFSRDMGSGTRAGAPEGKGAAFNPAHRY